MMDGEREDEVESIKVKLKSTSEDKIIFNRLYLIIGGYGSMSWNALDCAVHAPLTTFKMGREHFH